jgi:hypothetical protein
MCDVHPASHLGNPNFALFVAVANSAALLAYCPSPHREGEWKTDPRVATSSLCWRKQVWLVEKLFPRCFYLKMLLASC